MISYRSMQIVFAAIFCASLAGCAGMAAEKAGSAQSASQRHHVAFQVSDGDPKKWNLALNNAKNVQDSFGASNVDVEIVVYGPGIGMLKMGSSTGNRVGAAAGAGVKVVACENTMHAMKLTKADMLPTIGYVPAGVVELMRLEKEGYAYIRP